MSAADEGKGPEVTAFLDAAGADLWLLTEVNAGWRHSHGQLVVSPARAGAPPSHRWSGIQSSLPLVLLPGDGSLAAAEESLCLARMQLPAGCVTASVLVACSVLPWSGASRSWPGLPSHRLDDQAEFVLTHHVKRIAAARLPGEALIWGGDFNQALRPPGPELKRAGCRVLGTTSGIARLQEAFSRFELSVLTADAEHHVLGREAIDHLAISPELRSHGALKVHRPTRREGQRLSDHAAYVADIDIGL